jgi:hypothetical protein
MICNTPTFASKIPIFFCTNTGEIGEVHGVKALSPSLVFSSLMMEWRNRVTICARPMVGSN